MYIFESKFKHPVLVVKSHKSTKDGEILQEGRYAHFEDHIYRTEDEDIAEFIRKRPSFGNGCDYWERKEMPVEPKKSGLEFGVDIMDSEKGKGVANPDQRFDDLDKKINAISDLVLNLADTVRQNSEPVAVPDDEGKDAPKEEEKTEETTEEAVVPKKKPGRPAKK